jgi:NhaP-type Na+/H+ or K+/H+ antiporter
MDLSFAAALLIFGALLTVVAALSGAMRGTVLSASMLSVGAGIFLLRSGWSRAEAFLLGAVLSPINPVVTSAVVTSRLVPASVQA